MRFTMIFCLLASLTAGAPASAEICGLDNRPAATLLLPHFQVDTNAPDRLTTLVSVHNGDTEPVVAQVTLWGEFAHPVLIFQIYLAGTDTQTFNFRDVLNGVLPATAPDVGQFPGCPDNLPVLRQDYPPLVPFLRDAFTGQPVQPSTDPGPTRIFGRDLGDGIARGYMTIEAANDCTLAAPDAPGHFSNGGGGIASNRNVLWGDYTYVDSSESFAQAFNLVSLEAGSDDPRTDFGDYTFYARYTNGIDNREPLPTQVMVRYAVGGAFDGSTDLYYWRDSKSQQEPLSPGETPEWFPLDQTQILIFDEQDNVVLLDNVLPFPAETGSIRVGSPELPVPFDFGWIFLDLNVATGQHPPLDPAAQGFVSYAMRALGRFSTGVAGTEFDSACDFVPMPAAP